MPSILLILQREQAIPITTATSMPKRSRMEQAIPWLCTGTGPFTIVNNNHGNGNLQSKEHNTNLTAFVTRATVSRTEIIFITISYLIDG